MTDKAFKCPKCKSIQFKGQFCISDGSQLQVCSLEEENDVSFDERYHLNILIQAENGITNQNSSKYDLITSEIINTDNIINNDDLFTNMTSDTNDVEEIKQLLQEMVDEISISIDVYEIKAELETQKSHDEFNIINFDENDLKRSNKRDKMTNDDDVLSDNEYNQVASSTPSVNKQKKISETKKTFNINTKKLIDAFLKSSPSR